MHEVHLPSSCTRRLGTIDVGATRRGRKALSRRAARERGQARMSKRSMHE